MSTDIDGASVVVGVTFKFDRRKLTYTKLDWLCRLYRKSYFFILNDKVDPESVDSSTWAELSLHSDHM
jgi:hypothetical protein